MKTKQKLAAGLLSLTLITSAAPMSVSAKAKVKAPAKVTITSVKRVSNTKTTVKWKKLKKNTSGYAVYTKAGSSKWRLTKKVGKKTASVTFATSPESKYQVKVRAYKNGKKVKKYYNKKAKKFVSKKAYKKLKKKNRTIKKIATVKWGKYSSTKTINAIFQNKITSLTGSFNKSEDAALTWSKVNGAKKYEVYRSYGGAYKLLDTVSENSYTDEHYNPTKTVSYKVRPVNGAYTGAWSEVLTMRPQDISVPKKVQVPKKVCEFCHEDVTELSEEEINAKHSVYYCSICGKDAVASHNKEDIEKHIQEKHNLDENETPIITASNDPKAAEVKKAAPVIKEDGTKEIIKNHHHNWKVSTTTEERVVGYETKTENHIFCRICGEDMTWYIVGLHEYAQKNGYTIDDDEYYDNEFYKARKEHDNRDQEKYGKWGQNENRYVDVKVPIKKNITVNKYSCDCGMSRTD